jgi:hypothetical protein
MFVVASDETSPGLHNKRYGSDRCFISPAQMLAYGFSTGSQKAATHTHNGGQWRQRRRPPAFYVSSGGGAISQSSFQGRTMDNQRALGAARVTLVTGNPRTGEFVMRILEMMLGQVVPLNCPNFPHIMHALLQEAGPEAATIAIDSYNRVVAQHECNGVHE